jgi:hypothetical protein
VEVLNRETQSNIKWSRLTISNRIWPKAILLIVMLGVFTVLQYYRYNRIVNHDVQMSNTVEELLTNAERAKHICSRCGRPFYLSGIIHLQEYVESTNGQGLIRAEKDFKEVIQRNPRGLGTYLMLAEIKVIQEKFSEAKFFYEKAMKDSRHKSSALTGLKNLAKNKGGKNPESSSILK